MKLTSGEIFTAKEPLQELIKNKFPVKIAYELAKLTNKLNDQLKAIDDVRNGLIKTYGEVDPDHPQQFTVNPDSENFEKFAGEMDELFAQEIEVVAEKIKLPETLEIEPSVLMSLERFIEV